MFRAFVSGLALALAGCASALPEPPEDSASDAATIETGEPLSAAPAILRLRVAAELGLTPADVRLFEGELSPYHVGRVRQNDLPQTLSEREVPVLAWREAKSASILAAASLPLREGDYTLAGVGHGHVASVRVAADAERLLIRLWPPKDSTAGTNYWVFCTVTDLPPRLPGEVVLEPGRVRASVVGVRSDPRCLALESRDLLREATAIVPPVKLGEFWVDPSPIRIGAPEQTERPDCAAEEVAFGVGCAVVADDRIAVRNGAADTLWEIESTDGRLRHLSVARAGSRFVVGGLLADSTVELDVTTREISGTHRVLRASVSTTAAQPHIVLNEVLANARGAEPAQEWVELYNDGSQTTDLTGWTLEDSGGSVTLPSFRMDPGEFAVLVREDFVVDPGLDVPPDPAATLVRLPTLARAGFSNAGERLQLRSQNGVIVSVFPAMPSQDAGVSIARRAPSAPDSELGAFGAHAEPGASPGGPNKMSERAASP